MLIREVATSGVDTSRLAALAEFVLGRAGDEDASKVMSIDAFLNMAQNMGVVLSAQELYDASVASPLNELIDEVNLDTNQIVFSGGPKQQEPAMSVDKARDTVNKMAKRASKV
jgi:division protein CdvB (Snf7/Vps24/ESCRT-III family)